MKKEKGKSSDGHTWRFFRAGGFDQVRLDSAQDLLALGHLDQKLWVALACPVDNVHFDAKTLSLIDTDGDRRIRAAELLAAIRWTAAILKNPEDLVHAPATIRLQDLKESDKRSVVLAGAVRNLLAALGKSENDAIGISDTEKTEKVLSEKPFNGDGIITEEAAGDEKARNAIRDIIALIGSVPDRSGKAGVSADQIETFFAQIRALGSWIAKSADSANRPLGNATEQAAASLSAVREKVNDYFARCAVAEFDARAAGAINANEQELAALGTKPLSMQSDVLAGLPLARVEARRPLSLEKDLNPAWVGRMREFADMVVRPLMGAKTSLSADDWQNLLASFAPWFACLDGKPMTALEALPVQRIRELQDDAIRVTLMDLIARDKEQESVFACIADLEKLIRYRRDLYKLCLNFVNFKDFYSKGDPAIFQAGTLYLDQRSCSLCLKIDDPSKHSIMAAMAGTYLVYCECRRNSGKEKMNILAAFTNGDSENLIVGRNGVFYDRAGSDWDATIIKIIENPISLRQAFWLPYKSLVRMIESQVAKRAAAADSKSNARLEQTAITTANVDRTKLPEPPPKKLDVGIVAALGVAVGAIGTFIATLMGYAGVVIKSGPLAIAAALLGIMLVISGPSLILAYIKLRKRNLGPILDASGWALNAKALINVPFGAALTHTAVLPAGSQRDLSDPYAEKRSPWPKVVVLCLLLYAAYTALNHMGFVNEWTSGRVGLKKERGAKPVLIKDEARSMLNMQP